MSKSNRQSNERNFLMLRWFNCTSVQFYCLAMLLPLVSCPFYSLFCYLPATCEVNAVSNWQCISDDPIMLSTKDIIMLVSVKIMFWIFQETIITPVFNDTADTIQWMTQGLCCAGRYQTDETSTVTSYNRYSTWLHAMHCGLFFLCKPFNLSSASNAYIFYDL